jgi:large repetitive protein
MRRIPSLPAALFLLAAAAQGQTTTFPSGQVGVQYIAYTSGYLFCIYVDPCSPLKVVDGALPPGLSVGGEFSITGIPTQAGVFNFTLSGGLEGGPASITILNGGPVIQTAPLPVPMVGVPYNAPISVLGGTPPYKWSVGNFGSLPPGLSLVSSPAGEAIAGTPTLGGGYPTTLDVVDASGTNAMASLRMTVGQLVIIGDVLPVGRVGTNYIWPTQLLAGFEVEFVNGATFTVSSGSLPPGLVLSPNGTVTGTPTSAGTFPFTVTAFGATLAASINIVGLVPAFSTTSLPGGTVGQAYFQKTVVTGGFPPYTYTATGLPPGLSINAIGGSISGTPTSAGTFQSTLTATDGATHQGSVQLTLTIYPPLTLSTASPLPPATAGQPYSQSIGVTGGQPPYAFVLSGAAPTGLAVNSMGMLTGTPAAPGNYNFTIQVTDNLQDVISQNYQLTVAPAKPSIVAGGILNAASFAEDSKGHGTASAPGSLVSIYGNYPGATQATADTAAALPLSLGGASVTFNGVPAPLVSIFPSGSSPVINAQIPFEVLTAGTSSGQPTGTASVVVTINGQSSPPQSSPVAPFAPGIFTIPPDGLGTAILVYVDAADQIVKIAAPASASAAFGFPCAPIPRGASGFFYVTGLGAMTPPVTDGDGGGAITHFANSTPVVMVGGVVATEIFAGQAPNYPGIGQVNITVPGNAPVGSAVPLQLQSADGAVTSNIATIAIR